MIFGTKEGNDSGAKTERPTGGDPNRVKSGIPRLDYILKGGFLKGGTYILFGPPGAGKTILANQLCFNLIQEENAPCLYVTLLTESHGKMTRHLRPLKFFREDAISEQKLYYISGFQILRNEKTKGLLQMLRQTLAAQRSKILVIDGIEGIARLYPGEQGFIEFLYELMAVTQIHDCTTLLLTAANPNVAHPENAIVDGVVEISLGLKGPRALRELTIHKFRGSDFLQGKHELEISDRGIQIHPRTEIQFDKPEGTAQEKRIRMGFGIPELDKMLQGGPLSGSATALLGSPGTGKTFLGLSFLVEGAKHGHCGIYYGFYEPPPRLIEKAESIGLPLEKYVKNGQIELIWQPPLEHFLDSLAEQLLEKIKKEHTKDRRRLFIDGIEGFRAANPYADRMGRFLSAFTNQLRTLDVTTLISEELGLFRPEVDMPNPELGNTVESIILLRQLELRSQLYRLISILKMRESDYDSSIREFKICKDGVRVEKTFESAENLLTGQGRISSSAEIRPSRSKYEED